MRKTITAALAALTFGGAVMATAAPAAAQEHWRGHGGWGRGGWGRDHDSWGWGGAALAGVAGLALGAAIADSDRPYYYSRPAYYYDDPYYGRPYATCYGSREVWDPYLGHYIIQRTRYAC